MQDKKQFITINMDVLSKSEQIFAGVLKGFFIDITLEDYQVCLFEIQKEILDFENSIKELKKFSLESIKKGLYELGEVVEKVPQVIENSQISVKTAFLLKSGIEQLKYPLSLQIFAHLSEHVIVNGVNIYRNIQNGLKSYQDKEWFLFGEFVGKIMNQVLIGSQYISDVDYE